MSKRIAGAAILVAYASLAGCAGGAESSSDAPSVTDSAGVHLVEHPGDPAASAAVALELVWEHGHGPDDYPFQSAFLGAVQPDGGAVIGDMGNQEVVAIGPTGAGFTTLAGMGQGPGEVMRPRAILVVSQDTIWIDDAGNGKLLRIEGGVLAETVSTRENVTLARYVMPVGLDGDGAFLMKTAAYRSDFEQPWLAGHMVRFDLDTGSLDTLASYDMARRRPEDGINPFAPHGVADGAGRGLAHARSDIPRIIWRDATGAVTQVVRWTPTLVYPDEAAFEAFRARMRESLTRANPTMSRDRLPVFVEEQVARYALDAATPLPHFGLMWGADDGGVWLSEYPLGDGVDVPRYRVISADGERMATADFGRPFMLMDARNGFVLGTFTDELDVQAAAVYRYSMPGS